MNNRPVVTFRHFLPIMNKWARPESDRESLPCQGNVLTTVGFLHSTTGPKSY